MADSNTSSSAGGYEYVYVYDVFEWYIEAFYAFGEIFWKDEYFDWVRVLRNMNLTVQVNDLGYREMYTHEYDGSEHVLLYLFMERVVISYHVQAVVELIFYQGAPLFTFVACLGIASNVINFIVFKRQGIFKDSCTVTLTALTITDFLSSFVSFLTSVGQHVADVMVKIHQNTPMTSGRNWMTSRLLFINVFSPVARSLQMLIIFHLIGWVTSYLALERMVSVTFPFKVKVLITPKRTCAIITGTFLLTVFIQLPRYINFGMLWGKVDELNGTLVPELTNPERVPHDIVNALTFLNKFGISSLHVIVITACNIIVAIKVNSSQRFRKSVLSSKGDNNISNTKSTVQTFPATKSKCPNLDTKENVRPIDHKTRKELRLIRVMYAMSFTFLLTRIPDALYLILQEIMMTFRFSSYFGVLLKVTQPLFGLLETAVFFSVNLNGATNMLIYVSISQNYRKIFLQLFSCSSGNKRT